MSVGAPGARPGTLGWYNRLTRAQRERLDAVLSKALNAAPSHRELAARCGLSERVLQTTRSGQQPPTETTARALCPVVGTTLEAVLAGHPL